MWYTGRQYTPVLSIATCVTPRSANHALNCCSSSLIVPKVRTDFTGLPLPPPGTMLQATISFPRRWTRG
jgi:hypothetical protein